MACAEARTTTRLKTAREQKQSRDDVLLSCADPKQSRDDCVVVLRRDSVLHSDEEPISYYRVIQELNENLDLENSIVTHDAGTP